MAVESVDVGDSMKDVVPRVMAALAGARARANAWRLWRVCVYACMCVCVCTRVRVRFGRRGRRRRRRCCCRRRRRPFGYAFPHRRRCFCARHGRGLC